MPNDFSTVKSAALTATTLPVQGAAVVVRAARQGAVAVLRGVFLPLPLLLDVNVLLDVWSVERPSFRAVNPQTNETATYERWVMDFVAFATRYLGIPARRSPNRDRIDQDFTPLLASYFPTIPPRVDKLTEFRKLSEGDGVQDVLEAWAGKRTTKGWRDLFPQALDDFRPPNWERGAWVQFSTASGSGWLDEHFDHEAARIYFEALNPHPDRSQQERIDRLRRQALHEPNPLTESYEEQALYYGAITTATLSNGEYGIFKIINHSDPRISNPRPVRPPRTVHIHLCWAHRYTGLNRMLPALAFPHGMQELDGVRVTEVSVLQGFLALLFDDWRSALNRLDVRFHAHCGAPSGRDDFGGPGKRWKPSKTSGPMPPPNMIVRFFERATWCSVNEHGLSGYRCRSGSDWWCLVLLKSELTDFHIVPASNGITRFAGAFSAPQDAIPPCFSTLVVLDPANRDGLIYDITRPRGDLRFCAIPTQRVSIHDDSSFVSLRLRCLDALLAALEALT